MLSTNQPKETRMKSTPRTQPWELAQAPEPQKNIRRRTNSAPPSPLIISIALARARRHAGHRPASRSHLEPHARTTPHLRTAMSQKKQLRHLPRPPHRTRKEPTMSTQASTTTKYVHSDRHPCELEASSEYQLLTSPSGSESGMALPGLAGQWWQLDPNRDGGLLGADKHAQSVPAVPPETGKPNANTEKARI